MKKSAKTLQIKISFSPEKRVFQIVNDVKNQTLRFDEKNHNSISSKICVNYEKKIKSRVD